MSPNLNHRSLWSLDALSRRDVLALLDTARTLKRAGHGSAAHRPLRGKNVALLADVDGAESTPFGRAAAELGAHVSHIRPRDSRLTANGDVRSTAQMLGRLYDAIECEGMPNELVQEVERHAGVPVYNGVGNETHPTRALADLLTMAELSNKPLGEVSLCVVSDPTTPRGDALLRAAAIAGIGVRVAAPCSAPPHSHERCSADFIYDEALGGVASPLKLRSACGKAKDFDVDEAENRRYSLQALLVSTIS